MKPKQSVERKLAKFLSLDVVVIEIYVTGAICLAPHPDC